MSEFVATGITHNNGPHDIVLHNGRKFSDAHDWPGSLDRRGFCLVTSFPTSIGVESFKKHFVQKRLKQVQQVFTFNGMNAVAGEDRSLEPPYATGRFKPMPPDESLDVLARYQEETANAVKRAFPSAEVMVAYNQVLRSSTANAAASSENLSADQAVEKIVTQLMFIDMFPNEFKDKVSTMLFQDKDDAGFLDIIIAGHVAKNNGHAAMPGASAALQAEVREILRSDSKYDVVANVKSLLRGGKATWGDVGAKSADDGNVDPPAVNGIHTDVTEQFAMQGLPPQVGAIQAKHSFMANKYIVYHLNLWRNINPQEPIRNFHLAVLDKSSLAKDHAQTRKIPFDGYELEQYGLKYSPEQQWVYFPQMEADEILMFPQGKCVMEREASGLDEARGDWRYSLTGEERVQSTLHTAVVDPSAPEGSQRESCENRFLVFVPVIDPPESSL